MSDYAQVLQQLANIQSWIDQIGIKQKKIEDFIEFHGVDENGFILFSSGGITKKLSLSTLVKEFISTSHLINDGSDSTSSYVENDEIVNLANNGLSVRDSNNIEQFVSDEFIQLHGGTFNTAEKRFSVDPLQAQTIFISSTGSLANAEPFNINKPYPTLDDAVDAWRSMNIPDESSASWRQFVIFEILDRSNQTLTKPLVRPTIGSPFSKQPAHIIIKSFGDIIIRNDNAGTVFCPLSVNGVWGEVSTRHDYKRLDIETEGDLLLRGVGAIRTSDYLTNSTGASLAIHNIKCNAINAENLTQEITGLGQFYGQNTLVSQGSSTIECNNITGSGGAMFRGAMSDAKIKVRNIKNDISGSTMFTFFHKNATLEFDNIEVNAPFLLLNRGCKLIHGNINGSQSTIVGLLPMNDLDVTYKEDAVISVPLSFVRQFNSGTFIRLRGNSVKYTSLNQTHLFEHGYVGSGNNNIAIEINIKSLSTTGNLVRIGRGGSGVRLINTSLVLNGALNSGLGSTIDLTSVPDPNRLLECIGNCEIVNTQSDADIVYNTVPTSSGNFEVYIQNNLQITNGTINSNGLIVKPSGAINNY